MEARIRHLRRQIALYNRALKELENVDLWERYTQSLGAAEEELRQLKSEQGNAFYAEGLAAFKARLPLVAASFV